VATVTVMTDADVLLIDTTDLPDNLAEMASDA
jgi:hypothetical protein